MRKQTTPYIPLANMGTREGGKPESSPSCATHCAVTYPKTELGQSTRFSHRKIHCSRPLLCSSLVFSNVCRQSSTNKGSEVWDMSWRNHDDDKKLQHHLMHAGWWLRCRASASRARLAERRCHRAVRPARPTPPCCQLSPASL